MVDILVIPDVHCKVGVPNTRLTLAAKFALDRKPDYIVQIGDFTDFTSLCLQIKGKKSYEGKRYKKDIEVTVDGLKKFNAPIDEYNKTMAAFKRKQYKPLKYITVGNHDNRADREVELNPMLEGTIGLHDLPFGEYGWEVIPYLEPLHLEGIVFQHYFTKGTMDKAIGGINQARAILAEVGASCVQGHSHTYDVSSRVNGRGERQTSIVAGCFFTHKEDYTSLHAQRQWYRGLTYLHNVKNGEFDLEQMSMDRLEEMYG